MSIVIYLAQSSPRQERLGGKEKSLPLLVEKMFYMFKSVMDSKAQETRDRYSSLIPRMVQHEV